MRVALFVVVLAAHIMLLWLFPSLRRLVLSPTQDEATVTPIFLPPLLEPAMESPLDPTEKSPWQAPLRYRSSRVPDGRVAAPKSQPIAAPKEPAGSEATTQPDSEVSSLLEPSPAAPDWRAQAEVTAQSNVLQIVAAEDAAARRAAALTAHFKPMPGSRVRGPQFGWDYAPTHRITPAEGGGFVIALNDRCAILIFLIPMIGCSVGHLPPPNGDLFKYMHKPVRFGDWDWRLDDP